MIGRALALQMGDVAEFEAADWQEALAGRRADWVILDLDQLAATGAPVGAVLPAARAVLGGGGNLCLVASAGSGSLGDRLRTELAVRAAVRAAGRAGFREIRRYFAVPTAHAPRSLIPARRAAAVAFERMHAAASPRRDRVALARLGLEPALYRGHICLCTA